MLTYKRPGTGISPSELDKIIGKKAKMDIAEGKRNLSKDLES